MHIFRFLLYPFAMIYCGVTDLRNWLYDKGYNRNLKMCIRLSVLHLPKIVINN